MGPTFRDMSYSCNKVKRHLLLACSVDILILALNSLFCWAKLSAEFA